MDATLNSNLNHKKVLLGLSGGVDSTAATLLLQEQGFSVTGMFFDVLGNQEVEKQRAALAAKELGIDFIYRDVSKVFKETVIDYFCCSYYEGKTPNPCVKCNPTVKFPTMIEEANRIGAYHIATGHYAQIYFHEPSQKYYIRKAVNERKDQSYMLYRLEQAILSRLILPLGQAKDKEDIRNLLKSEGLSNAAQKDSQEVCFIKEENYMDYIKRWKQNEDADQSFNTKGCFVDKQGNVLGEHQGIENYTIGQRKGLGITFGKPMFVTMVDSKKNRVTLGENEELLQKVVISESNVLVEEFEHSKEVLAKIRYAAKPAKATLTHGENGELITTFEDSQRAVTPGQSIVFYEEDRVIGGGIIKNLDYITKD